MVSIRKGTRKRAQYATPGKRPGAWSDQHPIAWHDGLRCGRTFWPAAPAADL